MNRARTAPNLDDIRREIDAVDAELLSLLEQRFAAIEKIRLAKEQAGEDQGSPMRPGREAIVLRRLDGLRRGHLPQALMVRLWRSIMSAATTAQARTMVHISPAVMSDPRLVSCVAEQFPGLSLHVADEAAIAAAVAGTRCDIAVVPRDGSWMERFVDGAYGEAKVIGCLPLLSPRDTAPDLLVFGHARAEKTGEDRTIAVMRGSVELASSLTALWSQRRGDCAAVCLAGFLEPDAPTLAGLPVRIAGYYPSPLQPGN
ncbi:MAG: chorismate mutase [Pseudomonadota bacterium]|nr:chorismate mutase [Pseudomonadota bacterium]